LTVGLVRTGILIAAALLLTLGAAVLVGIFAVLHRRGIDRWIGTYFRQSRQRQSRQRQPVATGRIGTPVPEAQAKPVHLLLCIADHYEPQFGKPGAERAAARVQSWVQNYPRLFDRFRDCDGRPPRHTFFFPIDEYDPAHVDGIASLCRAGLGEVEIHHHHDNDTDHALRQRLGEFTKLFRTRHGLLPHDKRTGELRYGFVHGNWALDNSRPDGRMCGVNNELDVLRETGCYCDFTMPSYPSRTQTRKINSVYYAVDDPLRPRSHDWGVDVGTMPQPPRSLMLIQGPLLLDWGRRKGGVVPRIENACIQGNQPPTLHRVDLWLRARVQVPSRPDWFFVKLHTHGAPESNQAVLLGEPMTRFHEALASRAAADPHFHFHYATARELYNLARAAEQGWRGSVMDARDHDLIWQG